jgi:hypothetical protein
VAWGRLMLAFVLAAVALAAMRVPSSSPAGDAPLATHPFTIGVAASGDYSGDVSGALPLIRAAGMRRMGTWIDWPESAPEQRPASWDPRNPDDPHYNWSAADSRIKAVIAAGLEPIVGVDAAPTWARLAPQYGRRSAPDAVDFGDFMRAAAARYNGENGHPRVRYWQIWNEPNISLFFAPQYDPLTRTFTSPDVYRDMVNAAAASIHAAHADNVVIAGETAPFRDITPDVQAIDNDWGPLKFMRRLLCIDDAGRPMCDKAAAFDVWSTHPYTSGGPTHHAALPYDVSLGDLGKMRATLQAAARTGHIKSSRAVRLWITEFSWDSNPPDHCAPPMSLLKRWVPEAFYRMWANGVDTVMWFQLMDQPIKTGLVQSGLVFHAASFGQAKRKPFFAGFRFPFVALRRGARVYVWAHTPLGRRNPVRVQQRIKADWVTVKTLMPDRYGIAQRVVAAKPIGQFRAVLASNGETSLPFSMHVPPDQFFNPFGQATLLEPNGKACSA